MGMSAHFDEESSIAELRMSEGTGRFSKKVVAALSVGATLLLAPAAFYGGVAYGSHSTMPQSAAMDLVVEKDVIESEPKMQNCASATENCMSNKCCMTSGTKCWRISDTTAKCSKLCPGGNCWVEKPGYAFKPAYMTSSGTCPGDRPKDKKKDTKFVPTCTAGDTKAAVHPFRDVKSWFQCLGTITGKQYS